MRRHLVVLLVLSAVAGLGPGLIDARAAEVGVTAKGTRFNNSADCNAAFVGTVTEVRTGDTVVWRNCDTSVSHTVTSDQGRFPTQPLPPGGAARIRFDSAGRFEYFCEVHGRTMQGTIVVSPAQAATTTAPPAATTTTAPPAATTTSAPRPTTTTTAAPTSTTTTAPATTTTTAEATTTTSTSTTSTTVDDDDVAVEEASDDDADEGAAPLLVLGIVAVLVAIAVVGGLVWRNRRSPGETPQV